MPDGAINMRDYSESLDRSLADERLLLLQRNERLLRGGFVVVPLITLLASGLAVLGFVRTAGVVALADLAYTGVLTLLVIRLTTAQCAVDRGEMTLQLLPKRRLHRFVAITVLVGLSLACPLVIWLFFWATEGHGDQPYLENFGFPTVIALYLSALTLPAVGVARQTRAWYRRVESGAVALGAVMAGFVWLPLMLAGFNLAGFGPAEARQLYGLCVACQSVSAAMGVACAPWLVSVPLLPNSRSFPAFPASLYSRRLAENRLAKSMLLGRSAAHACWVLLLIALWGALPTMAVALAGAGWRIGMMGVLGVSLAVFALEVARLRARAWPEDRNGTQVVIGGADRKGYSAGRGQTREA